MIYGLARAYGSFDNVKIEPNNANTILVERELFIDLVKSHAAIARVRELHKQNEFGTCNYCEFMQETYPCETSKALDGEQ